MEAYHIDRFGSVDGIVLRSTEDPRPGLREVLMRVAPRASAVLLLASAPCHGPTPARAFRNALTL
jgi:hypothetical protein